MKFLQGIPIVGAAGGAYDAVYMKQIVKYAEMKYRRRFYSKRRMERKKVYDGSPFRNGIHADETGDSYGG